MRNGVSDSGFEDYVNMDHMAQPANVATRRTSRNSGIDDPMPFQRDAVRMRNNNGEDEQIYEICYDYKARQHDELDLRRGSVVKVVKDAETGWYQGLVDGKVGVFPSNYIRAIGPCNFKKIRAEEIKTSGLIGEGAAGQVWRAKWHGKEVAFKKFKLQSREGERADDVMDKIIYNVKREAAHFSNLRHVNIVELYGVCLDPLSTGLVLELCQGGTLSQVYRKVVDAAVPKRILVDWALQICAAMEAITSKFIHRDLKMDNVLVLQKVCFCALPSGKSMPDRPNSDLYSHSNIQTNGVCSECGGTAFDRLKLKLTDFGLSRENSVDSRQSQLATAGTSAWIAPEAYQKNDYSEYSDVWSFGVVLWELVTRKQPYGDVSKENTAAIPFYVAKGLISLETTKEFPTAIATIIQGCLKMDPQKRPKFREIRKSLAAYMEDLHRVSPAEYIELQKLEAALTNDMEALKKAGAFDEQMKAIEEEMRKYHANNAPKPAERTPIHKKVDKSQIGEPTEPRILFHIPPGGTLPRNMDSLDSKMISDLWSHQPLKPTLSKSQPNLNQMHVSPQSKMTRDRHQGIRKKKEKTNDDLNGYDEYMRESPLQNEEGDGNGSAFSQSHDERPHSSMHTGGSGGEKRGSDGSVSVKGGGSRSTKDSTKHMFHNLKKFFHRRSDSRQSISIDHDDSDHSVTTPSRSQSMSSTITSSALLYNSARMPIEVGMLYSQHESKNTGNGRSPDRRRSNGLDSDDRKKKSILPTSQTQVYKKPSPFPHPSSSPAGMCSENESLNGQSATNSAYSTLSSIAGSSRPSGLSQQQPLHTASSSSSSTSNTPVQLDEQYPHGGGGVHDSGYTHLQPCTAAPPPPPAPPPPRIPPELPPRRRAHAGGGDHFHPGLSTLIPLEQSSPTHMDISTLPPSTLRGRSRTVSGCTPDSPVGCVSSTPYIEMPPTAVVAAAAGGKVRGATRRDSSPDYILNPSYEPYRSMARRVEVAPCSPPLTDPPPLPPSLPPKLRVDHPSPSPNTAAAEYLTLSSK